MSFGSYCTIGDVKGMLGITATTDDTYIRKIVEAASRRIDAYCKRTFAVSTATKYLQGAGTTLELPDLLSVTTLKTDEDGDATFENTFAATDYILWGEGVIMSNALNTYPKVRATISDDSDYSGFAPSVQKGVEIAGVWGYGDGISATPYIADTTLAAAITSTSAATFTVTSASNISAGQLLLIDSEMVYVYSVSSTTVTCERGVNGTTAATHLISTALYIYQYPADIRQACIDLSVAMWQNRTKQGLQSERIGDYSYTLAGTSSGKGVYGSILEDIRKYKKVQF